MSNPRVDRNCYILFGERPCRQYEEGVDKVDVDGDIVDGELYECDQGTHLTWVLSQAQGWEEFCIISKKEFDYLRNKMELNRKPYDTTTV